MQNNKRVMNLEEKIIGDITGEFVIEAYQRGIGGQKMKLSIFLMILMRFLMVKVTVYNLL